VDIDRPKTRGDCIDGPRPCPWVGCRYHLYLDVVYIKTKGRARIVYRHPGKEPWELVFSCALDIADMGPHSLDEIGVFIGKGDTKHAKVCKGTSSLSREYVNYIQHRAQEKLVAPCKSSDITPDLLARHHMGPLVEAALYADKTPITSADVQHLRDNDEHRHKYAWGKIDVRREK